VREIGRFTACPPEALPACRQAGLAKKGPGTISSFKIFERRIYEKKVVVFVVDFNIVAFDGLRCAGAEKSGE
jgi:hypothetical protein